MPISRRHPLKKALALIILCIFIQPAPAAPTSRVDLLTYEELVELYERENPSERLQIKLQKLLTTPFVNNAVSPGPARLLKSREMKSGGKLRIALWNIERGLEYEALES